MNLTREAILTALREKLEPMPHVHAMWEGGAAANNRFDQWSDIDLQLDVDDGYVDETVQQVEAVFEALSGIELKHVLPPPTWHGHWQGLYRLKNTSPFLIIDFLVIEHSHANKFSEREFHGNPLIHFDKSGVLHAEPLDPEQFARKLDTRLESLKTTFELFQVFTTKELNRDHPIEAFQYYLSFTLRPLIEALRIIYKPFQHNYSTRYIYQEFPPEIIKELEPLYFVRDAADLAQKQASAQAMFQRTVAEITPELIRKQLRETA